MIRLCAICGKEFDAKTIGKYCSPECGKQGAKIRGASRRGSDIIKDCPICGERFEISKNGALTKYCSQDCADEARRIRNRERMKKVNPPKPDVVKECEWCGQTYTVPARNAPIARFCSEKCNYTHRLRLEGAKPRRVYDAERKKQKEETQKRKAKERAERRKANHRVITCSECGKTTDVYQPHQKTCSTECSQLRKNRLSWQRDSGRLNANNIVDKDITLRVLYRRDKGICYICGEKCNPKDYKRRDGHFIVGPTYPSIDHIIPLARGGKHAWDNVRLACHLCNSMKSDILPSELELDTEIEEAYALARKVSPRKKQVKQFDMNGEIIATYESTAEAERQTGIKAKGIQNCARGERPSQGGYLWSY